MRIHDAVARHPIALLQYLLFVGMGPFGGPTTDPSFDNHLLMPVLAGHQSKSVILLHTGSHHLS